MLTATVTPNLDVLVPLVNRFNGASATAHAPRDISDQWIQWTSARRSTITQTTLRSLTMDIPHTLCGWATRYGNHVIVRCHWPLQPHDRFITTDRAYIHLDYRDLRYQIRAPA